MSIYAQEQNKSVIPAKTIDTVHNGAILCITFTRRTNMAKFEHFARIYKMLKEVKSYYYKNGCREGIEYRDKVLNRYGIDASHLPDIDLDGDKIMYDADRIFWAFAALEKAFSAAKDYKTGESINSYDILLAPAEAALKLGVKGSTLASWRSTRKYNLPFLKIRRRVKYRLSDIDEFLEENLTRNKGG